MKRIAIALILIGAPSMLFAAGYSLPNNAQNEDGDEYATQPWVTNYVAGLIGSVSSVSGDGTYTTNSGTAMDPVIALTPVATGLVGNALQPADIGSTIQPYSANLDTLAQNNGGSLTNVSSSPVANNTVTTNFNQLVTIQGNPVLTNDVDTTYTPGDGLVLTGITFSVSNTKGYVTGTVVRAEADTLATVLGRNRKVDATGTIQNSSGANAADFNQGLLYDLDGIEAAAWAGRWLTGPDGETKTLRWGNTKALLGAWTVDNTATTGVQIVNHDTAAAMVAAGAGFANPATNNLDMGGNTISNAVYEGDGAGLTDLNMDAAGTGTLAVAHGGTGRAEGYVTPGVLYYGGTTIDSTQYIPTNGMVISYQLALPRPDWTWIGTNNMSAAALTYFADGGNITPSTVSSNAMVEATDTRYRQDNNTTYSAGHGIKLSGTTFDATTALSSRTITNNTTATNTVPLDWTAAPQHDVTVSTTNTASLIRYAITNMPTTSRGDMALRVENTNGVPFEFAGIDYFSSNGVWVATAPPISNQFVLGVWSIGSEVFAIPSDKADNLAW